MQTRSQNTMSAWRKLRNHEITCEQALKTLVDEQGNVDLKLIDREVTSRFFRNFPVPFPVLGAKK